MVYYQNAGLGKLIAVYSNWIYSLEKACIKATKAGNDIDAEKLSDALQRRIVSLANILVSAIPESEADTHTDSIDALTEIWESRGQGGGDADGDDADGDDGGDEEDTSETVVQRPAQKSEESASTVHSPRQTTFADEETQKLLDVMYSTPGNKDYTDLSECKDCIKVVEL